MSLEKTSVQFNFASGIDTLTDSVQLPIGKFTSLQNSIFIQNEGLGRLDKDFGYDSIASFTGASFLTHFRGGLLGVGNSIYAYSNSITANIGYYQPLYLNVLALNRNQNYPTIVDSARANNGFIAYVYRSLQFNTALTSFFSGNFFYSVVDGISGQPLVPPTPMPKPTSGSQVYSGRVFSLNNKFVFTFDGTIGSFAASSSVLNFFTIDQSTLASTSPQVVISNYRNASSASYHIAHDGTVAKNTLYLAMSGSGSQILATTINSAFVVGAVTTVASTAATMMSVVSDTSSGTTIYASWVSTYRDPNYKSVAFNESLVTRFSAQNFISSGALASAIVNITSAANNGVLTSLVENAISSGVFPNTPVNAITGATLTSAGVTSSGTFTGLVQRQVGLASKAFITASQVCFLSMYYGPNQSTYFLHGLSGSTCNVMGKMAYGNAYPQQNLPTGGSLVLGLPSANTLGSSTQIAFLEVTSIQPVSKANVTSTNSAIYSTPGINVSTWTFSSDKTQSVETASNLHLNGGFLWSYDGVYPVEQNFFLYPDKVVAAGVNSVGEMTPQTYFYQVLYRWQDNQGNIHRSAPSIPVQLVVSSGTGNVTVTVSAPMITQKPASNPISVQCYRWSQAQQTYYKLPVDVVIPPGNLGTDSILFADLFSDNEILGNEILYTNGGVLEDIGLPAVTSLALFDTRLWAVSAEDENLLYYAKPGVESAPVEMSDLQTYFVPPNVSGVSVPGGIKVIFGMDDKLIIFKQNSIMYINGIGPDATGIQNGYSNPILITNGIGCTRPNSIVLIPQGLMFQSDKGIWLLGRDLSMNFIGKEVEYFNSCPVVSAVDVPGTNEVRFTLGSSGQTLKYDYFAQQWNQRTNVPGVSATIYQSNHAILSPTGTVSLQSDLGYTDGGISTTMGFTTGWINLMGLQGYVRAYRMYLLGKFYSPHTYTIGIAYDYNPTIVQTETINPTNSVGSGSQVEQWQVNFQNQQCQSFQLTFTEISSSTAGAGLSLSGVKLVFGAKKDFPRNLGIRNKV